MNWVVMGFLLLTAAALQAVVPARFFPLVLLAPALGILSLSRGKPPWMVICLLPAWACLSGMGAAVAAAENGAQRQVQARELPARSDPGQGRGKLFPPVHDGDRAGPRGMRDHFDAGEDRPAGIWVSDYSHDGR